MTQPTNIDYKSIEEQVEETKSAVLFDDNGNFRSDWCANMVARALTERDAIARHEERNRIKEWVQTQVNDGSGQCIHYEEILEALTPNDKE